MAASRALQRSGPRDIERPAEPPRSERCCALALALHGRSCGTGCARHRLLTGARARARRRPAGRKQKRCVRAPWISVRFTTAGRCAAAPIPRSAPAGEASHWPPRCSDGRAAQRRNADRPRTRPRNRSDTVAICARRARGTAGRRPSRRRGRISSSWPHTAGRGRWDRSPRKRTAPPGGAWPQGRARCRTLRSRFRGGGRAPALSRSAVRPAIHTACSTALQANGESASAAFSTYSRLGLTTKRKLDVNTQAQAHRWRWSMSDVGSERRRRPRRKVRARAHGGVASPYLAFT